MSYTSQRTVWEIKNTNKISPSSFFKAKRYVVLHSRALHLHFTNNYIVNCAAFSGQDAEVSSETSSIYCKIDCHLIPEGAGLPTLRRLDDYYKKTYEIYTKSSASNKDTMWRIIIEQPKRLNPCHQEITIPASKRFRSRHRTASVL